MTDKRPIAIWHRGDADAYYAATSEERDAWNAYAQMSADAFDNSDELDSYDSTRTHIGVDRDGKITSWCPPLYFPEWLEQHRNPAPPPVFASPVGANTVGFFAKLKAWMRGSAS